MPSFNISAEATYIIGGTSGPLFIVAQVTDETGQPASELKRRNFKAWVTGSLFNNLGVTEALEYASVAPTIGIQPGTYQLQVDYDPGIIKGQFVFLLKVIRGTGANQRVGQALVPLVVPK